MPYQDDCLSSRRRGGFVGVEPGLVSDGELVVVVPAGIECGDAVGVGSDLLGNST